MFVDKYAIYTLSLSYICLLQRISYKTLLWQRTNDGVGHFEMAFN